MSRKDARDIAFKLIFEYMFSGEKKEYLLEEYTADFSDDDTAYVREIYNGVSSHFDEISSDIRNTIKNYELERVYNVDRAILSLAIYEIKYVDSVPFKVSVDEALNLAKKYSEDGSAKFINGVLAQFERQK